jgi:hypothetical protein
MLALFWMVGAAAARDDVHVWSQGGDAHARLESESGDGNTAEGLGDRLDAALARRQADPERAAREDEAALVGLRDDFAAGLLSGLGLRLYRGLERVRQPAAYF